MSECSHIWQDTTSLALFRAKTIRRTCVNCGRAEVTADVETCLYSSSTVSEFCMHMEALRYRDGASWTTEQSQAKENADLESHP